jgi:hypothetical protein
MSIYYIIAGPAAALIGIVSVFFVLRRKSVEKRSMYSSRRSQIERKVRSARSRTLAPKGRGGKAPTEAEIAAATPLTATPAYEAPRTQSWDTPAAPAAPAYEAPPAAPAPAYEPPAYQPPPAAPSAPAEPMTPAPSQPEWTPAPAEAVWTPAPSADIPRAREAEAPAAQPDVPAGEGAAWSIVGDARPGDEAAPKDKDKGKKKDKTATGSAWELSSGGAPGEDADDEPKKPSAAVAIAQYAVLVVGLVMVLIGVLVMVANSKVT